MSVGAIPCGRPLTRSSCARVIPQYGRATTRVAPTDSHSLVRAGLAPALFYDLRSGYQVQDYLLVIRSGVGTATGIRVALIGPAGEVPGGVLVVVSTSPQGDEGLVLDEDLLDTLDGLHLHALIRGRGILVQELVGCGIVPGCEVELALANLRTVQVLIVQVVWRGATNHTTEHHLVVKLAIRAQGVVIVLANRHVVDLDTNSLCLGLDHLRGCVPVGKG